MKEKKQPRKRISEKQILAQFFGNCFIGGQFFKKGSQRITEEQQRIIEETNFIKKGKVNIFNL